MKITYIQCQNENGLETVEECDSPREARKLVDQYRSSDRSAVYYLSSRPCKAWKEASKPVDTK